MESVEEIREMFSRKSLDLLRSLEGSKTLSELTEESGQSGKEIELALLAFCQIALVESFTSEDGTTCYRRLHDKVQIEISLAPVAMGRFRREDDLKSHRRWILRKVKNCRDSFPGRKELLRPRVETPRQRWERICTARADAFSARAGQALDQYQIIMIKTHDEEAKKEFEEATGIDSQALMQIYWDLGEQWTLQALKWRRKVQCFDEKTGQGGLTLVPTGQPTPTLQIGPSILNRVGANWKTVFRAETDGRSIVLTPVEEIDDDAQP
jgi:hypothetical protein